MFKCKVGSESDCRKVICCFSCDENKNCQTLCGTFLDLKEEGKESPAGECKDCEELGQTDLQIFENKYLEAFKQVAFITTEKKRLEDQEKKLKEQLEKAMNDYGIDSIDNQFIKITRVKGSSSISIDLKTLESKDNNLYKVLLDDYPKITTKKAYLMFKVK